MRRVRTLAAGAVLTLVASVVAVAAAGAATQAQPGGFEVSGTQLLDANGNPFALRGTHLPHVWFPEQDSMYVDSSGLGANSARVALGAGLRWEPSADVGDVVEECKRVRLVCVLSPQDATGYGDDPLAASMMDVVENYWAHPEVQTAVQGEEAYVLVNIANAPLGDNRAWDWTEQTVQAVQAMRDLGYAHTLVLDAPNWGEDVQQEMLANAAQVAASDPLDNVLFSVHMRESFEVPGYVAFYLNEFETAGLALAIGDFSPASAYSTVQEQAQLRGTGWTACCWSGSGGEFDGTDQVSNFDPDDITDWGKEIFLTTHGIQDTAERVTVFPGCGFVWGPPDPPDGPGPPGAPRATEVTSTSLHLDWGPACGDPDQYLVMHVLGGAEVLLGQTTGHPPVNRVSLTDLAPGTTYEIGVRAASDGSVGPLSDTIQVTTLPAEPACTIGYLAEPWGTAAGYTATVMVTNLGSAPIDGWTVQYEYPPGQTVVPPGWNATVSQDGTTVTAVNASWNANIPVGGSVWFGYNGQFEPPSLGMPTDATLNGVPCLVEPGDPPPWP